jgi:hypothetical protein
LGIRGRFGLFALLACLTAAAVVAQDAPVAGVGASAGPPGADMQQLMEKFLKEKLPPPLEPALPAPSPDPRVLEGTWIADQLTLLRLERDMYGNSLPLNERARHILERRVRANYVDKTPYENAAATCRPAGQVWQLGLIYPFHVFQRKDALLFLFSEMHTVWSVRMNGSHRKSEPQYMGDSVGHWDGNTLVVDTTGYRQPLWIDPDGTPASAGAHATFRIRRIDYGQPKLEIVMTVDDPAMYTAPWSIVRTFVWRPDFALFQEHDCEPRVNTPDKLREYGYQPEPGEAP